MWLYFNGNKVVVTSFTFYNSIYETVITYSWKKKEEKHDNYELFQVSHEKKKHNFF